MIHKLKYVIVKHRSCDHHDKWHEDDEDVVVESRIATPHDENKVTISIVRQAIAGVGKDFTYPTTSKEATGLYQYIDNHIKNFDLSWQILD